LQDEGGFTITDSTKLATDVLPDYFAHCQFASFVRQLSNYRFVSLKDKRDNENGPYSFRHAANLFQKDRCDLVPQIKRRKEKRPRRVAHQQGEQTATRSYNIPIDVGLVKLVTLVTGWVTGQVGHHSKKCDPLTQFGLKMSVASSISTWVVANACAIVSRPTIG